MKKFVLLFVLLSVLLVFTAYANELPSGVEVIPRRPQFSFFDEFEELPPRSTHVVRVEVLERQGVEEINTAISGEAHYTVFTVSRVRVLEVFQGDFEPGEKIDVRQSGGLLDNVFWDWGITYYEPGDDLLLFLGLEISRGRQEPSFSPIQPFQAAYHFPVRESIETMGVDTILKSVYPDYYGWVGMIEITVNDLIELAEANFGYVRSAWADGEWQLDEPAMNEINYPEYPNGEAHPPEPETEEPPPPDTETGSLAQRLTLPLAIGGGAGGGLLLLLFWLKRRKKDDDT